MKVIYHNRSRLPAEDEAAVGGARYVSKQELLQAADHVVLVVPYSPEAHTIGAAELALMKPTATLTNIAPAAASSMMWPWPPCAQAPSPPPRWMCLKASPP